MRSIMMASVALALALPQAASAGSREGRLTQERPEAVLVQSTVEIPFTMDERASEPEGWFPLCVVLTHLDNVQNAQVCDSNDWTPGCYYHNRIASIQAVMECFQ